MQKLSLVFEKTLFWLVIFLLAFIPLYPKFPLINVVGTFVAIRFEDLTIAFIFVLWFTYLLKGSRLKDLFGDNLAKALLVFFFIGTVSLFSSIFVTHTVLPHLGLFHYLRRIEYMTLLLLIPSVIRTKKQIIISLVFLGAVVFLVNVYAIGQQLLNLPVVSTTNSEFSKGQILTLNIPAARVNSTFAGHYDLAIFLVMALTLLITMFFWVKKWILKIVMGFLAFLSFLVLILTAARLSFIAAIVGVVLSLVLIGQRKLILFLTLLVLVVLIFPTQLRDRFISTLTVNVQMGGVRHQDVTKEQLQRSKLNIPTLPSKYSTPSAEPITGSTESSKIAADIVPGEPTNTTQLGVYRSLQIRLNVEWPRAIRAFMKNPLLGSGYSSTGLAVDNDFLRSLAEVGLLGSTAFLLILIGLFKRIWANFRSQDRFIKYFSAGVVSLMVAFLVNGLFIDIFEASKIASVFWIILGLNLAAGKIIRL